jgi:UDP-N-acetylmuramoylalanine--D-glutamate ligase
MEPLPRRILILGLGRSGVAVARYLAEERDSGVDVTFEVADEACGPEADDRASAVRALGVAVSLGAHAVEGAYDLVVASPGIPPSSALMRSARASGAPVISEVALAFWRTRAPFGAVTGTNGKTTTTALVAHLLREAGMPAEAVGNIGAPVIAAVRDAGPASVLVTEVSSFQLALTCDFRPRVAVLLNITPDHADWHGSLEAYESDKTKVFANMGAGDTAVIDVDDKGSAPWAERVEERGIRVVRVSRTALWPGGASVEGGMLTVDAPECRHTLVRASELLIRGEHNVGNALAGAAAALTMGATPDAVRSGLRSFEPIEHRLEPAGVVGGVEYFNDSKATNPDAVQKALTAFDDSPVVVLLGGRNKGNDFRPLALAVAERCRLAVLFGEARAELVSAFRDTGCATVECAGMADAVRAAAGAASPGDVVLLSPACASFDEFRSYGHRGDVFKELVSAMACDPASEAAR